MSNFYLVGEKTLSISGRFRRLVGKLNYHTVTPSRNLFCISKPVLKLSLLGPLVLCDTNPKTLPIYSKKMSNWGRQRTCSDVGYSDVDWTGSSIDRPHWRQFNILEKQKKQSVVAISGAETEYKIMVLVTCKLIQFGDYVNDANIVICDTKTALHIASNPVFHEDQTYWDRLTFHQGDNRIRIQETSLRV
jgi:hypothetical protein